MHFIYATDQDPRAAAAAIPDELIYLAIGRALFDITRALFEADKHLYNEMKDDAELGPFAINDRMVHKDTPCFASQSRNHFDWATTYLDALLSTPKRSGCATSDTHKRLAQNLLDNAVIANIPTTHTATSPFVLETNPSRNALHKQVASYGQSECNWTDRSPPLWLVHDFYVLSNAELEPSFLTDDLTVVSIPPVPEVSTLRRFGSLKAAHAFIKARSNKHSSAKHSFNHALALGPRAANSKGFISAEITISN